MVTVVHHTPVWVSAQLRVDAAGNTAPGFVCVHPLENGSGFCGGNVFRLDQAVGDHCCVVDDPPTRAAADTDTGMWAPGFPAAKSLRLAYAVAGKLVADPDAVRGKARSNLARLRHAHPRGPVDDFDTWQRLLDGPLGELLEVLTARTQYAADLRRSCPFAGVLTDAERRDVLATLRRETGRAAIAG